MNKKLINCAFIIALPMLYGCGGGSSGDSTTQPSPNNSGSAAKIAEIVIDGNNVSTNQAAELILYAPDTNISNITWSQTSGQAIDLVTTNHKVLSVVPTESGNYEFQVSFNENGQAKTLNAAIDVSADNATLSIPTGQAVLAQNKVSVRVFSGQNEAATLSNVNWRQTQGPSISLSSTSDNVLIFKAPAVSQDTLFSFEASANVNNRQSSETVTILVEQAESISNAAYFDDRVARVFPYNPNSPYANQLANCVYSNALNSSCTLDRLPLLAQQTLTPSVDDVMNRVVVSHQWMGDNFKAFLEQLDPHNDFKQLLRATTAVVIAYDVRPSFYWAATGAIYLDAENFWLTPRQRDTINEAPDFRSGLGDDLQFAIPWRYVKDNDYAFEFYAKDERVERPLSALTYPLGYLLYHELAHANDFFPQTNWSSLNSQARVLDAALDNAARSELLTAFSPLESQVMKDLAQVRYNTGNATDIQKAYLPQDVRTLFEPDKAVHFYGFSTEREDFAMLFEELMMQHRYGVQRDVAVTNNPNNVNDNRNDYIVEWGQRGRLSQPQIVDRAAYTTNFVYPEFDAQAAIAELPAAIPFVAGASWRDNLSLSPNTNGRARAKNANGDNSANSNHRQYHYYSKPLPKRSNTNQ
ncbi:hypothetical protein [Thalassotalea euphylliae]|uniref:Lipoprotein n=1 Tax=Thalassotalea euphylliae TaxID=1655234 RepID=A0A3E0TXL2_9GAMM|nr:hypothetical protein [Thalassotalea euphylliae]REL29386.1 hypothetical protein DXX94_00865 [Thalassotalea euphylliae]